MASVHKNKTGNIGGGVEKYKIISNTKCGCCNENITSEKSLIPCSTCSTAYHKLCVPTSTINDNDGCWSCPGCCVNKPKGGDNTNTPVRPLNQMTNEDSLNITMRRKNESSLSMCEWQSTSKPSITSGVYPELIKCIGDMLDTKLEGRFERMISELKMSLKEDIKAGITQELNLAIEQLKDDFTVTTDFLADDNKSIRKEIQEKDRHINELSKKCLHLQSEIKSFSKRINDIDRQTRSLNLELHMVPEKNNENVLSIFKKLCEHINYDIANKDISACRRVAKLNPKSPRPRNILVTLSSIHHRDGILSAVQRFNKSHNTNKINSNDLGISSEKIQIYVAEHLSPESKEIHAAARKCAKEKAYKFVWVKYGRVYMRKDENNGPILVKNLGMLDKL